MYPKWNHPVNCSNVWRLISIRRGRTRMNKNHFISDRSLSIVQSWNEGKQKKILIGFFSFNGVRSEIFLSLSLLWSFNSVRINCRKQISFSLVVRVWEILLRYLLSGFEVQMERERTWDFITIEKISLFISRQRRRRRRCHHVWVHFLAWTASSRSPWRENEHECEKKR